VTRLPMHSNPAKISAKDDRGEGIGLLESLVLSQGSPHRTASGEMDSDRLWAIFTPAGRPLPKLHHNA
jgi:hypothetical protein